MSINTYRGLLYKLARIMGDVNAAQLVLAQLLDLECTGVVRALQPDSPRTVQSFTCAAAQ